MPNSLIIAIDGPSGSGKSSVSRAVATELGLDYLDTGSMYRAMTWFIQELGIDVNDAQMVAKSAKADLIQPSIDPSEPGIRVAGRDVSLEIRGPEVTQGVSAVSAVPEVRSLMVNLQREIASNSKPGIVVEGRDICAVVLPEAPVRLFITADPDARANRRAKENGAEVTTTQADLEKRDLADSTRAVSPLEIAPGARVIDTTYMELSEVIAQVVDIARAANG
ncbi:MAG: (d)CMP kinase [Actinobacteria bacterium]|jgi:cytidylate kinase|nr:(d)CMP kinase [Actinomycetota bacterium]NBO34327.1 (d)CMP kinase [Actinomycetota bacterium]